MSVVVWQKCHSTNYEITTSSRDRNVHIIIIIIIIFLDPGTSFPRCETLSKVCELSGWPLWGLIIIILPSVGVPEGV